MQAKDHLQLSENLDLIDFERATKVSGTKFYYFKNQLVWLELALVQYALSLATEHGFKPLITPDLAKQEILEGLGFNPRGESTQVYNIADSDLSLIGTAEITMGGYHKDETFDETELPKKYVALSHCFRTEAGSYSKFAKGIFRVHQFTKVEMFYYTTPEKSENAHEELLDIEKKIFKGLDLPFRVIDHSTADLGTPAYRTFDLEVWLPGKPNKNNESGDWAELTSASNCTDYQARGLNIKYRDKAGDKKYLHMLNGTAVAIPRAIIAIMENYQQADGSIAIPKVLRKYLPNNLKIIKRYDKSDMLKLIESFPGQCREAEGIGSRFEVPASLKADYTEIVCAGMGGSAIGADIIRSYISDEARIPFFVNRNYALPAFVDSGSLVIVSSYSGNTEETLSAYQDAKSKKAKIVAITSGGELEKRARSDGFAVLKIPGGLPPRCALGYSFFPALKLLSQLGVIPDKGADISEAIEDMERLKSERLSSGVSSGKNISKSIAGDLYRKYPVIYACQDHTDCAATRWRGELAENSKTLSSTHLLPEMNHNEIVGWENPKELMKDMVAVILRDAGDNPRVAKRMDITKKIISREKVKVLEVNSCGKGLLARIFSLIYTGDFVSFYLAILNGCDPTPVERIDYLKKELARD